MTNCTTTPSGNLCPSPSGFSGCKPWDITQQSKTNCLADSYLQETLAIAGAIVNVHNMLGVHEQTKILDLTGNGNAISSGDVVGFPASNAFSTTTTQWLSRHTGDSVINSTYIGYDFGIIKLPTGRQRYGIEANIYHEITTIKIKQSSNSNNRVVKARVERSNDGIVWYGVDIVFLPDDDKLNTIYIKHSTPSRYWRLRPIEFVGTECDSWGIQALEMHEYSATDISNIQDTLLMENRDRDYNPTPITLKGYYELVQANTDLQKFGIELDASYSIKINFNNCIQSIGRPIVIGDIIELPSETQYTPDLKPVKRYLDVTDVTWDPTSYTPGWLPTMLLITAMPALASQETRDIFGDIAASVDNSGLMDIQDGNHPMFQDFSNIDQSVQVRSLVDVPERGSEGSNVIREFEQDTIDAAASVGIKHLTRYGLNRRGLYVEDALPQNDEPYTEGTVLPLKPNDGDYHRLTYEGLAQDVPPRLYRYSVNKGRWVYLETDRRQQYNGQKNILEEYITNPGSTPARNVK